MGQYVAPVRDMQFVLHELLQVENELKQLPKHAEVDADIINQVLEEGGKFTSDILFPLNRTGDHEGCRLNQETHEVTTPKGFKEAYRQYIEAGWPSLSADPEYGGQP
ncbi:MAG: acyl-CoA dehydrogenase, partial [Sphingobacteriales bacterium]